MKHFSNVLDDAVHEVPKYRLEVRDGKWVTVVCLLGENMHAIEYADRLRDTTVERELAKELRAMPEEERYKFVNEMLDVHLAVALDLANRCLRSPEYFIRLLETGLARVQDLSSINLWLGAVVPRLGVRNVIGQLRNQLEVFPFAVGSALYFVPSYIDKDDVAAKEAFRELKAAAKKQEARVP